MAEFKNNNAKRYFWLKLKTDFFDQKEIKLLRKLPEEIPLQLSI